MSSEERLPEESRFPIPSRSTSSRQGPVRVYGQWFPPSSLRARSTEGKASRFDPQSRRGGPDRFRWKLSWTRSPGGPPKSEVASRSYTRIMIRMTPAAPQSQPRREAGHWRSSLSCLDACIITERRRITASCSWPRGFRRRPRSRRNPTASRNMQGCRTHAPSVQTCVKGIQRDTGLTVWAGWIFLSTGSWSAPQRSGGTKPLCCPHRLTRPRPQPQPGPPVTPTGTLWRWRMSPWTCWLWPSERAAPLKAFSEIKDEYFHVVVHRGILTCN